ncbi:MAG: carbamoyltransferase [SAR324 cluster bacterium]|nr:carbamoyltransferase [SAR324 cluster bacterium]
MKVILGISALYHDSAACLLEEGKIVAAAQEERFTRKKQDARFPEHAIRYCLKEAGIQLTEVEFVTFYEKPFVKFERLLETYLSYAPLGILSFAKSMPIWLKEKLFQRRLIENQLIQIDPEWKAYKKRLLFAEHHQSHAASAFFPSPFEEALILTMDGVGEWTTASMAIGHGNQMEIKKEIKFPHSLGLLYSAFTYYTGFKVNSGEYKVMGLAPYGEPKYVQLILDHLIDLKEDGSFALNMGYFDYCKGLKMTNSAFNQLFGAPPRKPESELGQKEMDLARSIQEVTEEVMLRIVRSLCKEFQLKNLCLAGGVALNCVANGRILRETPVEKIWIQPAAGDAGGAVGAAYATWHQFKNMPRAVNGSDQMAGSYLGPRFPNESIQKFLKKKEIPHHFVDEESLFQKVAESLQEEKVIGWMQGRMEFGPRSLGGRSILGDPRSPKMQSVMNLKIKYRESFRPFAPSILNEHLTEYFDLDRESPYMLLVAPVAEKFRIRMTERQERLWGIEKLNVPRSNLPAITHVDYSARIQTVHQETNPRYHRLISTFYDLTGCPVLVNTSFNVRGEPIVCTPEDAYRCFMRTEMDVLVLENFILYKNEQPKWAEDHDWRNEFELD